MFYQCENSRPKLEAGPGQPLLPLPLLPVADFTKVSSGERARTERSGNERRPENFSTAESAREQAASERESKECKCER